MNNAVWLILALPEWYFSALAVPFSGGMLTMAPAVGALSLVAGVILGLIKRERRLLYFLIPFVLSEALVGIAGALRGEADMHTASVGLWLFLGAQVVASGYLVYRLKAAFPSAVALAVFSVTYAHLAAFVAGMSLTDTWI